MAIIGSLGETLFIVTSKTVQTFDNMKWDSSAKYAEHDRHLKDPLLEFTGNDADRINFEMFFNDNPFIMIGPSTRWSRKDLQGCRGGKQLSQKGVPPGWRQLGVSGVTVGPATQRPWNCIYYCIHGLCKCLSHLHDDFYDPHGLAMLCGSPELTRLLRRMDAPLLPSLGLVMLRRCTTVGATSVDDRTKMIVQSGLLVRMELVPSCTWGPPLSGLALSLSHQV